VILTVFMRKSPLGNKTLAVTFLGTGDAFASRGRFQSGYIIEGEGCRILMEAGPTVLMAMKRMNFDPGDLDLVLISHLHGDHFGGLPFLILDYVWETPRHRPLTVAGPRLLGERTWRLFRTMYPRASAGVDRVARQLKFVVLEPGGTKRLGKVRVDAIRTPHMARYPSLALKVTLGSKTVAFTGDTGWTDDLLTFSAGADLFICECTYFDSTHLPFHLNYPTLAEKRPQFDVGRMVLSHLGREVLDRGSEVSIEMAHDGLQLRV
jgi:ribonuclease BN (tRNA processing enzyme)